MTGNKKALGTVNRNIQQKQTTGTGHRDKQQGQALYGQTTGKENRKKEQGQAIGQATRISNIRAHLRQSY